MIRKLLPTVLLCVLVVLPAIATRVDAHVDTLAVTNFTDNETIRYDLPLLKGVAHDSSSVTVVNDADTYTFLVNDDGHWRGFVSLNSGTNDLEISSSGGATMDLTLSYIPPSRAKRIRLVYFKGVDSSGKFDAPLGVPNGVNDAITRIRTAGRVMQSMTAELLYERGYPRYTFAFVVDVNGEPQVDIERSSLLTVAQIRDMKGNELWFHIHGELSDYPNRADVKDVVIIADCTFDSSTGQTKGCTARGGGRLALFGSATLHTFPETVKEIEDHFLDPRLIESYLFPEYGRSRQYWSIYTTSLGAILHETGHCFGLPHSYERCAIMSRGFDYLNRLATTYEPGRGTIDPATDMLPCWSEANAGRLVSNLWLTTSEAELWAVEYRWGDPPPGYSFAGPVFESWMDLRIENRGDGDAYNVTASITDAPINTEVPDPDVTVGDILAGGSAWSTDTFTTRVDMTIPGVDPCEGIVWRIEYDDAAGIHHVIEGMPQFPPGEGPCN